jgi:hypothetical protein
VRKVRWTQLGPPSEPRIAEVRWVGKVRITQEDVQRFGQAGGDPEIALERAPDDPEADYKLGEDMTGRPTMF